MDDHGVLIMAGTSLCDIMCSVIGHPYSTKCSVCFVSISLFCLSPWLIPGLLSECTSSYHLQKALIKRITVKKVVGQTMVEQIIIICI